MRRGTLIGILTFILSILENAGACSACATQANIMKEIY